MVAWANLYVLITRLSPRARFSRLFLEGYLLSWIALMIAVLVWGVPWWPGAAAVLAAYRVLTLLHSRGTVFVEGRIQVANVRAAILTVLLNIVEVINCFAVIILCYGKEFSPAIDRPLTAVYMSTVTFLTLGYGDFHPRHHSTIAHAIVISELWCFLFFLVMLGPLVFGLASSHYRAAEVAGAVKKRRRRLSPRRRTGRFM